MIPIDLASGSGGFLSKYWWLGLLGPFGATQRFIYVAIRAGFQSTIDGQDRLIKAYEVRAAADSKRVENLEAVASQHAQDLQKKNEKIDDLEKKVGELETALEILLGVKPTRLLPPPRAD